MNAEQLRAKARDLTRQYMAGGTGSFDSFRELVQLLLGLTVLADNQFVTLRQHTDQATRVLGGIGGPTSPVRLRDNRWLRLAMTLRLTPHEVGSSRLKVEQTSLQYQCDEGGQQEVFRYDYLRHDSSGHPAAHINVHGTLYHDDVLAPGSTLARVHFPTARVSLEAVLRLLMVDFGVPSARPRDVWQPVLAESEQEFQRIAHQPRPPGAVV